MLHLIPQPKILKEKSNYISAKTIHIVTEILDERIQKAVQKLPLSDHGIVMELHEKGLSGEAYTLAIAQEKIVLTADGAAGLFYGIQTLRQIFAHDKVPCLYIEDTPDFGYRGFYHDVTRGKVPKVETLKKLVDDMAYYKLNSLQLYVEHTFAFAEYADSIERTGYLTAEEIRELDDYCYENFIACIPSLSCFGHLYELLQKDKYKDLRELDNYKQEHDAFWERMQHHTIDPTNPKSFALVKSLIDQYMPLFRSDTFNICCDETFDLKIGRHKDMDTGRLYVDFVRQIAEYVRSKGKTVMMWADILLKHREMIKDLPEDIQFLNWYYDEDPSEEDVAVFQKLNRTQIVCPGTGTWTNFVENIATGEINICRMAELGLRYGAAGVLNTNWGDFGNPCSLELAMYGMVLGAAKSWSVQTKPDDGFRNAINYLLYRNARGTEYLMRLSALGQKMRWYDFVKIYSNCIYDKQLEVDIPTESVLTETQKACEEFVRQLTAEQWENDEYRKEMLLAAEGIEIMAELTAQTAGYLVSRRTDTETWLKKYRQKWLEKNKESELSKIETVFLYMDKAGI